ncbi:MAG: tetratricopeptide repeat protein [Capsulimonadales bacterium]|nr:tetratricopeptide repeat protein [Capsulimonadales bacterium]
MNAPKSPAPLNAGVAITAVLAAAAVVGLVSVRSAARKPTAPNPTRTPVVAPDGMMTLETLLGLSPETLLKAIPDPGTKTASAREVIRWRTEAGNAPKAAVHWVNLGDALMQQSREKSDPHCYDFAHAAYAIALKNEPQNIDATVGMAWVAGSRHQFDKSIELARQAIALDPNRPAPYGLIGDAQVEMGDYDAAFESYQKMLDIRPDASSYSRGAHLLFLTGNTTQAMRLMSLAIKAGGPYTENGAWCRAQLADMLWQTGMLVPAEVVLKEAVKQAPDNYQVLNVLGRLRQSRGDLRGAEAAYRKAIAASPQHAALVALGDLYLAQGRTAQAEETFRQVETANAHHQQHGDHDPYPMAAFYADHDRQLDQATRIIGERPPKSPTEQEIAAWVHFKSGRLPEAKALIDSALKKGPSSPARYFRAGMIYARLGERRKASGYLNHALSRNPHFQILQAKQAAETLKEMGGRPPSGDSRQADSRRRNADPVSGKVTR